MWITAHPLICGRINRWLDLPWRRWRCVRTRTGLRWRLAYGSVRFVLTAVEPAFDRSKQFPEDSGLIQDNPG